MIWMSAVAIGVNAKRSFRTLSRIFAEQIKAGFTLRAISLDEDHTSSRSSRIKCQVVTGLLSDCQCLGGAVQ